MTNKDTVKEVALNIRRFRESIGMTRDEFCEKMNFDTAYWGTIERGERKINLQKMIEICEEFQIEPGYLIRLERREEDNTAKIQEIARLLSPYSLRQLSVVQRVLEDLLDNLR